MTIATLSEGPAILVGYAWRLQIEAEAPVFAEGASYAGHLRLKPSDPAVLAELSSADGGIQHITGTVTKSLSLDQDFAVLEEESPVDTNLTTVAEVADHIPMDGRLVFAP